MKVPAPPCDARPMGFLAACDAFVGLVGSLHLPVGSLIPQQADEAREYGGRVDLSAVRLAQGAGVASGAAWRVRRGRPRYEEGRSVPEERSDEGRLRIERGGWVGEASAATRRGTRRSPPHPATDRPDPRTRQKHREIPASHPDWQSDGKYPREPLGPGSHVIYPSEPSEPAARCEIPSALPGPTAQCETSQRTTRTDSSRGNLPAHYSGRGLAGKYPREPSEPRVRGEISPRATRVEGSMGVVPAR